MIFDTSALLALTFDEPGGERVQRELENGALISAVNMAEVVTKLTERGFTTERIVASIGLEKLTVVAFDGDQAFVAGLLRQSTRSVGLSLGDRCCLALGLATDTPVLTADRAWANLDMGV